MCGIIGYIGYKKATPVLLGGLKRLEYRGYDSAGLATIDKDGNVYCQKTKGNVEKLEDLIDIKKENSCLGIGHNRWGTHGAPSQKNAHPHWDSHKNLFVVHNGIIENADFLREALKKKGHSFHSETDSEVLPHLFEEYFKITLDLEEAVRLALKEVKGAYAIAVISNKEPDKIVFARQGSPLLIGLGEKENFIASDAAALIGHTREVVYLNEGEMGFIKKNDFKITNLANEKIKRNSHKISWNLQEAQKKGFVHFMLKEIHEAPQAVQNAIRGRTITKQGLAKLGGLEDVKKELKDIKRLIIVSCGTSYYASLLGEYMIEEYAGLSVEVEYTSEFRYRKPLIDDKTAVLSLSQSGETADTLAALREAKEKGALTLGIVNVVGSTIARETDAGIYNHAGPEIGVASTKNFISQLAILALLTVFLGRQRDMSLVMSKRILEELQNIPNYLKKILNKKHLIQKKAEKYARFSNFLYLGRKYNYPIALEGALKLKEISYLHAEAYPAGEMKHGPIALIDKNFPTIALCPSDSVYDKVVSNLEEIKTRQGPLLILATCNNLKIKKISSDIFYIPKTLEMLTPFLTVLPLQLFAYYIAVLKKRNVDKPRNLAKSVTVE
jgi:glutamine---fructose-6-phosphate transaminase (isomerizing)